MLLAVDSGRDCGWALFSLPPKGQPLSGGALVACGLRDFLHYTHWPAPVTRIVVERQHPGRTRARVKDIITLAIRAGEVGGLLHYLTGVQPEYIEPNRWKGQLPKKRCNEIVEGLLRPEELAILNKIKAKGTKHNVLDAIGIGLFLLLRK